MWKSGFLCGKVETSPCPAAGKNRETENKRGKVLEKPVEKGPHPIPALGIVENQRRRTGENKMAEEEEFLMQNAETACKMKHIFRIPEKRTAGKRDSGFLPGKCFVYTDG